MLQLVLTAKCHVCWHFYMDKNLPRVARYSRTCHSQINGITATVPFFEVPLSLLFFLFSRKKTICSLSEMMLMAYFQFHKNLF